MEESFTIPADDCGDSELDPRIQVELEHLNAATDEINKLETELEESNTTFRLLLGESSRRLQGLAKRFGSAVDKSRPYYEALEAAGRARSECQKAAVQFQRASELHAAAKETVTLAEQRFVSKQDEWQFDSAWQEVLNHAIIKVMDAERRKTECGRIHHQKAVAFNTAERKVAQLEENLRRNIIKSRLYFEEKQLCEEQLKTQKDKIERLQQTIANAKLRYAQSLRTLEVISEEIHRRRGEYMPCDGNFPVGPREPGVGAEHETSHQELDNKYNSLTSTQSKSSDPDEEVCLQELRMRVRELALKPIDEKISENDEAWATELNETINKLDQLLMMKENNQQKRAQSDSLPSTSKDASHLRVEDNGLNDKATDKTDVPLVNESPKRSDKSMMSLDVVSLARDTAGLDKESYLKAIIEEKSPPNTYLESLKDANESPDEVLTVEFSENEDDSCRSSTVDGN